MEARIVPLSAFLSATLLCVALPAATYRTQNFVVTAESDAVARQVGEAAEHYRRELAIEWLGEELPNWYRPCPITVKVGQIGAGGATTFTFEGGEVFGWKMKVQGPLERILDSVIPHEVCHTIFACHFRRPLPRWADEGAATLVEEESERMRQVKLLEQIVRTSRRIPLRQLLAIKEYPRDSQQVMTLYAEGYSLADFLVQHGGKEGRAQYLAFLKDALEKDWSYAFRRHYGYESLEAVEQKWTGWVLAGSPPLRHADGVLVADNGSRPSPPDPADPPRAEPATVEGALAARQASIRAQSPEGELPPLAAIARQLRTRPRGSDLSAPEPTVTAMPALLRGDDVSRGVSRADDLAPPRGPAAGHSRAPHGFSDPLAGRDAPRPTTLGGTNRFGSVSDGSFSP